MTKVANYNISLKCFLKNTKGETLILKTSENSSFLGTYDFPGGRIDENEFEIHYKDILKREIFEETGIEDVKISDKVIAIGRHKVDGKLRKSSKEDNYIFYIFFEGFLEHNDISVLLSNEHEEVKWVNLEKIIPEEYFISGYLEAVKMYLNQ